MGNVIREGPGLYGSKQEDETDPNLLQNGSDIQGKRRSTREPISSFGPVPKNISSIEQSRPSLSPSKLCASYPLDSHRESSTNRLLKSPVSYDMSGNSSLKRLEQNSLMCTESSSCMKDSPVNSTNSRRIVTGDSASARLSYRVEEKCASPHTPTGEPPSTFASSDTTLRSTSAVLVTPVKFTTSEKCVDSTPLEVRKRGKAIMIKPIDRPGGKFLNGKHFYLQIAGGEWEKVTIEHWNSWNGTWQVRGPGGIAFPAAPIALKSEEEYGFLSRERSTKSRSFKSLAESSTV